MRLSPLLLAGLLLLPALSGCLSDDDKEPPQPEPSPFDFDQPQPPTTYFHFPGGLNASVHYSILDPEVLTGDNVPFFSQGSYYGTGFSTFEPTIAATQAGNLFMTNHGGAGRGTHIIRCDLPSAGSLDYTCEDMGPVTAGDTGQVPNSNDPYVYGDLWTDRLMKFDMHALLGMTVEYSDNEGESWTPPTVATGYAPQDHQTIASAPNQQSGHETTYVFCINAGVPNPLCSTSFDGGNVWTNEVPGTPPGCNSGGLTGHITGADNGNFYRGNVGCTGSGYSIYSSSDSGFTWDEHVLPTSETGTADTWNFEEVAVSADEENNIHVMWMGLDNLPYYSYSLDLGASWAAPLMVAPPGVNGTGFPALAAGSAGRVAVGYIGTTNGGQTWNGYLGVMTDSFNELPLITTVVLNDPSDPLENNKSDCGYDRCGGFGDFIDMVIGPDGRPWFGLAHNPGGEMGIFGTFAQGPSLRGELNNLTVLPLGGPATL